jgi:hypothetical protein
VNVVGKDFREDFLNEIGWVKEETFSHLPSLFLTVWNSDTGTWGMIYLWI